MNLTQLIAGDFFLPPEWDREFNHLVVDSRDIRPGNVFIARQGHVAHGEQHIKDAVERGAVAVLAEGEQGFRCEWNEAGDSVPVFIQPEVAEKTAQWLHRRYPTQTMQLIAVTGTNGKSSVTQYIAQLAKNCGKECGVLGTLGNGRWPELKPTRNTTPDLSVILQNLSALQNENVTLAALEVSSHGLSQKRVAGLPFDVAVLTNITQDHLDYHGTMDAYYEAKRLLFTDYAPAHAIINIDDEYGRRLAADAEIQSDVITFGHSEEADIHYRVTATTEQGMEAAVVTPWGRAEFSLPLIGEFNLANTVAAIAALAVRGFDFNGLIKAASLLRPVAGRMELYIQQQKPLVVVDFAHTPDALKNVLQALKPWNREITCVFGCGGDRDRSKRPLMAKVATEYADVVWLSDDNPRTESPQQIFTDALADVDTAKINQQHNRRMAIRDAVSSTDINGIVLIAGKGHENYQDINGVKYPYSDADVLAELGYVPATEAGEVAL